MGLVTVIKKNGLVGAFDYFDLLAGSLSSRQSRPHLTPENPFFGRPLPKVDRVTCDPTMVSRRKKNKNEVTAQQRKGKLAGNPCILL